MLRESRKQEQSCLRFFSFFIHSGHLDLSREHFGISIPNREAKWDWRRFKTVASCFKSDTSFLSRAMRRLGSSSWYRDRQSTGMQSPKNLTFSWPIILHALHSSFTRAVLVIWATRCAKPKQLGNCTYKINSSLYVQGTSNTLDGCSKSVGAWC